MGDARNHPPAENHLWRDARKRRTRRLGLGAAALAQQNNNAPERCRNGLLTLKNGSLSVPFFLAAKAKWSDGLLGGHRAEPSSEDGIQNSASGARYAFRRKHAPRETLGASNGDHAPKEPPKGMMSLADRAGGAKGK
jgi:hypothetical protein